MDMDKSPTTNIFMGLVMSTSLCMNKSGSLTSRVHGYKPEHEHCDEVMGLSPNMVKVVSAMHTWCKGLFVSN